MFTELMKKAYSVCNGLGLSVMELFKTKLHNLLRTDVQTKISYHITISHMREKPPLLTPTSDLGRT